MPDDEAPDDEVPDTAESCASTAESCPCNCWMRLWLLPEAASDAISAASCAASFSSSSFLLVESVEPDEADAPPDDAAPETEDVSVAAPVPVDAALILDTAADRQEAKSLLLVPSVCVDVDVDVP